MMAMTATIRKLKLYIGRMTLLLPIVLIVGCNSGSSWPVAHLHGKVTIDGQPLPGNLDNPRIMFVPPATGDNRNAKPVIATIVDGQYDAPDVPTGPITVRFDLQQLTGREFARGMTESVNLVPMEHQDGIAIEVTEGDQAHDFEL